MSCFASIVAGAVIPPFSAEPARVKPFRSSAMTQAGISQDIAIGYRLALDRSLVPVGIGLPYAEMSCGRDRPTQGVMSHAEFDEPVVFGVRAT